MRRLKTWPILASIAAGALALSGCGSGADGPAEGTAVDEQVLRVGLSGEPPVLKAGTDQGNLGMTLNTLVHRGLVAYDQDGELVPALASDFEQVSASEYRFTLREGLKFQDETDVTVESVRKTFEYFADPENGSSSAAAFANVAAVEEGKDGSFSVKLKQNNSAFLQYLADPNTPILPERGLDPTVDNNIGAGPFQVADREAGVRMTLEDFDSFYGSEEVALDELDIAFYSDGSARVNALLGGDVDLIDYVPWESFSQVEAAEGYTLDSQNGPGIHLEFNTETGPFADPEVRRAVAYAIDRQKVADTVFEGAADPVHGVIVQTGGEFDTPAATEMYEYNPEKAKQILEDAGYPDGLDASLLATSQYAFHQDTALSLQADLAAVGIRLKLDLPDWATVMDKLSSGNYEMGLGAIYSPISDPSYLLNVVTGSSYVHSWGYENDDLNGLLRSGVAAETDEQRREDYEKAFGIIAEETPMVMLVQRGHAFAYSDNVSGFKTLPGFLAFFSGYTIADVEVN